tara:strand:+ start:54 stop:716 length:663 start_codon:yes stop_codon:yes gene_type:complete
LEGIKIELVDVMGDDSSVSNSARVSFNKWKEEFDESDEKLISYLAKHKHMTPFRHNQIQIRCKAPIFLVRQLGKHQAGLSWNEVSRRYVDTPPELFDVVHRVRPEGGIKQGSNGVASVLPKVIVNGNLTTIEELQDAILEWYELATDKEGDYLIAPETARAELPQSMQTEWVWSGNLLAFAHVYKERIASGAQLEAQDFANKLDSVIRPIFPVAWSALVD